jgi:Na+/glutamate symporter
MKYGIPGSVMIGLVLIGAGWHAVRVTPANSTLIDERDAKLAEALGIVLFLTIYLGFTVHYWGAGWILVAILAACRAHLSQLCGATAIPPASRRATSNATFAGRLSGSR